MGWASKRRDGRNWRVFFFGGRTLPLLPFPLAAPLGGLLLAAASQPSLAGCTNVAANSFITPGVAGSPTLVTCSGAQTSRVGQGGTVSPAPPPADFVNVTVQDGASIAVTNQNAISLGSGSASNHDVITVGSGSAPGRSRANDDEWWGD